MFNDRQLWQERFKKYSKDISQYLRYIFNGHLVIVMLFLLGTLAFYYQGWVMTLTPQFPAALLMMLVLVFFVTNSPTYSLIQHPDQIFLLPVETKLSNYFFRAQIFSVVFQSYILLIILAALMPVYVQVQGGGYQSFFKLLAIIILLKVINLSIQKKLLYYVERSVRRTDFIIRALINGACLYLLFSKAQLYFVLLLAIVLIGLDLYYRNDIKDKGLKWELVISLEEQRMNSFYRLANLFTDVPHLKEQIKRRRLFDLLLNKIPFGRDYTLENLYARTFIRSGDYFGLFLRLTVIGSVAIYFIPNFLAQLGLTCLFIYLTGFQLVPLRFHHDNNMLLSLYPTVEKAKLLAFQKIIIVVLVIQGLVFSMLNFGQGRIIEGMLIFSVGTLFAIFFVFFYSRRLINNKV